MLAWTEQLKCRGLSEHPKFRKYKKFEKFKKFEPKIYIKKYDSLRLIPLGEVC